MKILLIGSGGRELALVFSPVRSDIIGNMPLLKELGFDCNVKRNLILPLAMAHGTNRAG